MQPYNIAVGVLGLMTVWLVFDHWKMAQEVQKFQKTFCEKAAECRRKETFATTHNNWLDCSRYMKAKDASMARYIDSIISNNGIHECSHLESECKDYWLKQSGQEARLAAIATGNDGEYIA